MGDWRVTSRDQDFGTNLVSAGNGVTTYTIESRQTGETREVVVWSGERDYELRQLGEKSVTAIWTMMTTIDSST